MNDLPERSQFQSRLPEDPGYWNGLAARIGEAAEPILEEYRKSAPWWGPMARWGPAIGVAAAAAAMIAAVTMPAAPASATPPSLEQVLSPDDPVARAVVGGESAASISTMLLVQSGGGR